MRKLICALALATSVGAPLLNIGQAQAHQCTWKHQVLGVADVIPHSDGDPTDTVYDVVCTADTIAP